MKTIIYAMSIVFALGLGTAQADTGLKLGWVDLQAAAQKTKAGVQAKKDLEKTFKVREAEIEKKKKDFEKMQADLQKKRAGLSDEVFAEKQRDLQIELQKVQKLIAESRVELSKKERDLTLPIIKQLRDVIDEIAEKDKYSFIFEKSQNNLMFGKKELDITEKVVELFEKNAKKKK